MTNPKTRKTGCAQSPLERQQQQHLQPPHLRNALRGRVEVTVEDDIHEEDEADEDEIEEEEEEEGQCVWEQQQHVQADLHATSHSDVDDENNEEDDEEDRDSSSSFSLQECFNEFRARRIRRISTQSRDAVPTGIENTAASGISDGVLHNDPADADLINQNRSNKEHERKCKPCQNGFCYCFTSDSGEGGGGGRGCGMSLAAARGTHVRHSRRSRKSDSSQVSFIASKHQQRHASKSKERRRQSAPATFKVPTQKHQQSKQPSGVASSSSKQHKSHKTAATSDQQLTAISRLETTSKDAPLIHIIQELRNNCVISEVRVNKHKMQAAARAHQQRSHSFNATKAHSSSTSPKKTHFQYSQPYAKSPSTLPSALPALDKISEIESQLSAGTSPFITTSPLDTSTKTNNSTQRRRRHKAAGLLLQKRLSLSQMQYKPRNLDLPPPKPPRSALAFEDTRKSSVSTLASTSPSVRAAEFVLDDFLRNHGIKVPGDEVGAQQPRMRQKSSSPQRTHKPAQTATTREVFRRSAKVADSGREKRKSYPLTQTEQKTHFPKQPLPTCPSLSDIERVVASTKKSSNYEKNIRQAAFGEKPVKEISFGWNEPKITEMLNCDTNAKRDEFRTKAKCAQPQSGNGHAASQSIGWKIPHKIDLDTVDGNLASNIESKNTPVKTRLFAAAGGGRDSQKFIWGEQWRNLSPWTNKRAGTGDGRATPKQKSNLKSASSAFLNNSKKKILRLVSPKKDNKEARPFQAPRKTPLRTVGVQTSREDLQLRCYENSSSPVTPQSPPGSYHSVEARPLVSQQSTTTISGTSSILASQSSQAPHFGVDAATQFDFSRIVQSPPKKTSTRGGISQRKLNFPMDCSAVGASCLTDADEGDGVSSAAAVAAAPNMTKTYRSFHSDLDQDVTLSKMGYILGNIRAKLEASDEHALRTFQEIERRELRSASFDIPDSHNLRQQTRVEIHRNTASAAAADQAARRRRQRPRHIANEQELLNEPIYSEIEEDSILFFGSQQFDNKTGSGGDGIQHFAAAQNPEALYAKINKAVKRQQRPSPPPTALGKFLHDSIRHLQSRTPTAPLPPVPEPQPESGSDAVSYSTPPYAATATLSHCHSLNNIRVKEHHSPPKLNRNLNKSDLSLHRSEIFLDNLCRSEIIVETGETERQEKVNNHKLDCTYESVRNYAVTHLPESTSPTTHEEGNEHDFDDSGSYDLPHDDYCSSIAAGGGGSTFGLSAIAPPQSHNQSTPKKATPSQSFMTKPFQDQHASQEALNIDVSSIGCTQTPHLPPHNQSSSCPTTPHQVPPSSDSSATTRKQMHAASLDEVRSAGVLKHNKSDNNNNNATNPHSVSTLARYKRLKDALRKSLRKSKNFVKSETKRLSTSLTPHSTAATGSRSEALVSTASTSTCNLDTLFALDESAPVAQQLAKAVSICRQLPDLEISPEMVEAERLLLFSSLRKDILGGGCLLGQRRRSQHQLRRRFFIDAMRLPVRPAASQDLFFNYFYIGAFECGGVIRSTQSVECRNSEAIFRDCGIEFACTAPVGEEVGQDAAAVRCEIFMLRLRKVSTLSLEPRKSNVKLPQLLTHSPNSSIASSASRDEIVSRFRLHASFTLKASDFAPFEYVASESKNSNQLCLRVAGSCSIPLTLRTNSTNLASEILLSGRAEARFAKRTHSGFLNVQEPHSQHNWNRRWCTLDGLQLHVWQDANDLQEQPLISLDLRDNAAQAAPPSPLVAAPRELCARPRSFCLQCAVRKAADSDVETEVAAGAAAVFFAADTQADMAVWLRQLNAVLDFVVAWLQ